MKRNGFFAQAEARTAVSPASPRIDRTAWRETTSRLSCELRWLCGIGSKQPAATHQIMIDLAVAAIDAHGEFEAKEVHAAFSRTREIGTS